MYLRVNLDSSLNLESHFDKIYKRAAGRFNLLKRIRPLIDKSSAQKIYKAVIRPVFTYCGTLGLCWSRSRKNRIESIERRSQKVIGGNYQVHTVESLCLIVFRIASVPLLKDILHKLNTTLTLETMGVH